MTSYLEYKIPPIRKHNLNVKKLLNKFTDEYIDNDLYQSRKNLVHYENDKWYILKSQYFNNKYSYLSDSHMNEYSGYIEVNPSTLIALNGEKGWSRKKK